MYHVKRHLQVKVRSTGLSRLATIVVKSKYQKEPYPIVVYRTSSVPRLVLPMKATAAEETVVKARIK
jgi:hypothetical protein